MLISGLKITAAWRTSSTCLYRIRAFSSGCLCTQEEITKHEYSTEEERAANRHIAEHDRTTLLKLGIEAARAAGKNAFWVDFECIRDEDGVARTNSTSYDVYEICDVVRAAHSMIIVTGPSVDSRLTHGQQSYTPPNAGAWLRQWGSRLWTLPEILLCPVCSLSA